MGKTPFYNQNNALKNQKENELEGWNIWKFVQVQILSKNIKLQLNSGSDMSIINLHIWRKLGYDEN